MRTIIAGSRTFHDYDMLSSIMESLSWKPTVIISGCAPGVDKLGEQWAKDHNIPIEKFPADWDKWKSSAGTVRNGEMALEAEALVAIWCNNSRGTANMIEIARSKRLTTYIVKI